MTGLDASAAGRRGEDLAKWVWPSLRFVRLASAEDRRGIDAYEENIPTQVKYDVRISESDQIYHELYEKTKGHPEQCWRPSPHQAQQFIFVTEGWAARIPVDVLAQLVVRKQVTQISGTSIGVLIPRRELMPFTEVQIFEWEGQA